MDLIYFKSPPSQNFNIFIVMTLLSEGREGEACQDFRNVTLFPPFRNKMSLASLVIAKGFSADQSDIVIQGIKFRRSYAIHPDRI
jgi:hypothetical protein